ncbi:MAG: class I SAM-dependent rRNA methyltransferase [Gammaproteobacteria bacterium]|nr:class I SAM-dependent rRNA methyltransferase [Gammaproteobacteria bacterium]
MTLAKLILRRREERRVQAGHPWVFSNEVATDRTPLTGFTPGEFVNVLTHSERALGTAYVNPHSLICARLVSRDKDAPLDAAALHARLERALALRRRLGWLPDCRLVYGESDALPGLVVDGYGTVLVVQIGTAGMERLREEVVSALVSLCAPRAVVLRNDLASRELEGLESYVETVHGSVPEPVVVHENGCEFEISPLAGQKTGWYYDHRLNRARGAHLARDTRVLDCFSYAGGFGIQAAAGGAREVLCVDSSRAALDAVVRNAERNRVGDRIDVRCGDVFETLRALRAEGEQFDLVMLDPPAFVRRKKDLKAGSEAYARLNRLAMQVLPADGYLLSASCSSHLSASEHQALIRRAARDIGRELQILERGHQAPDHPVHPALPETEYLKTVIVRVLG